MSTTISEEIRNELIVGDAVAVITETGVGSVPFGALKSGFDVRSHETGRHVYVRTERQSIVCI